MEYIVKFKLILILGSSLEKIRHGIENFESLHLGIFINQLRYKTDKEGRRLKRNFIQSSTKSIIIINEEITNFNSIINYLNKLGISLPKVERIDNASIRKAVTEHRGHYAQSDGSMGMIKEIFGESDSPSSLARQHTALRVRNIILQTKMSLSNFVRETTRFVDVFDVIQKNKIRKITQNEIEKAKAVYSIALFGEAVFILGRLLENLLTEYLIFLKKSNKISLPVKTIKSRDFDFQKKIEFLHSKKFNILSDSQFSKLLSVKWDRNIYGHRINVKSNDYKAIVAIALSIIVFIDTSITRLKKK